MYRRIALAAVALTVVLAGCGDPRELNRAAFRRGMESSTPEVYHLLKDGLPEEYAHLEEAALNNISRGMSAEQARHQASEEFGQILNRHQADAALAPSADLRAAAESLVALLRVLQSSDPETCAVVAEGGTRALNFEPGTPTFQAAAANNLASMRAIVHGRATPTPHSPLSQSVARDIVGDYQRRGGSMRWLQEMSSPVHSLSAADRCRNAILLNQIMIERGDEVIASSVASATAARRPAPAAAPPR